MIKTIPCLLFSLFFLGSGLGLAWLLTHDVGTRNVPMHDLAAAFLMMLGCFLCALVYALLPVMIARKVF